MPATAHHETTRGRRRRPSGELLADRAAVAFRVARANGIDPGGFRLDASGGITVLDKSVIIATTRAANEPADEFEALEREGRL